MVFPILPANTLADTGYDIDNSCRFNDDDSASMSITPGSSGNPDKWTFSCWFKRGNLGAWGVIFAAGDGADNRTEISLEADPVDVLRIFQKDSGSTTLHLRTDRKFRDCSAWYHLCLAVDTGQGTDANKFKIYINGVLETSLNTATYFSDDTNTLMSDSSYPMYVGRAAYGATAYWDGYLADCVFINDAQLAVSNFGETDEDSGIWKPIDVSGLTAGTNGFYLDFKDSANLGNDAFGGTDLTESNLAATDQTTDTPTNNFATLNPLQASASVALSEGNTKHTNSGANDQASAGTMGFANGKWYWEIKCVDRGEIGINLDSNILQLSNDSAVGSNDANIKATSLITNSAGGSNDLRHNGGTESITSVSVADGDIINIAVDADNGKIWFGKAGTWFGSGDPAANSNESKDFSGEYTSGNFITPVAALGTGDGDILEYNFGNPPFSISSGNSDGAGYGNFEYAVPSGFYALCTKNLAEYG